MNMPWKQPSNLRGYPAAPTPVEPALDPIKAAIDELAGVRAAKKAAEKREEKLKEILDCLGAGTSDDPKTYDGNKVRLQVTESYPERFDGRAFEADYPEVYAKYKRKADNPQRTLTIKPLV